MSAGFLKVMVHTGDNAMPVAGATVTVFLPDGRIVSKQTTDANGNTSAVQLRAPDVRYTFDPYLNRPAYSVYDADISAGGYVTKHIHNVGIVDTQTSILPVDMLPLLDEPHPVTDMDIVIPPVGLLIPEKNRQAVPPPSNFPEGFVEVLDPTVPAVSHREVFIPDFITVHLGLPTNASARNVRVRFSDYIKNVVSSEIYSTWPRSSLEANIHAIVTFALNRVYTEWYPSRGFNFNITNSTSYDMFFREGAQIFQNISELVDEYFNAYARRTGFENPFFTQFCNGTTATCNGLSQWGTVSLANQGKTSLEILRYYYTRDLEVVLSNNIRGITESYPGYPLSVGNTGEPVRRMQNYLNRIRANFPLIPPISNPNGVFGPDTADAVRTFQRTFNMAVDGIIGRATWNKINFTFVGVTRLAELESEGIRVTIGENPPNTVLSVGSRGADVIELQFLLNIISPFYETVPPVIQNGVFDVSVQNAVKEFQKTFSLTPDGVVGPATWNKLYAVYRGIEDNALKPPSVPPPPNIAPPFPGTLLRLGSGGPDVKTMQTFLNTIAAVYPSIPQIIADGVFGVQTQNAVKAFQQRFLLTPDGIIGPITWDKIVEQFLLVTGNEPISLTYPGTPLRVGSTGSAVRLMQTFLSELRSPYPSLPAVTIDGIFGPNTEAAVRGFQRIFGLTPDGIIGPVTWYAIIEQRNNVV